MKAMEEEVEFVDYLRVIWNWKQLIVGGVVLCGATTLIVSLFLPKEYQTTIPLRIGRVWEEEIENSYRVAERINSEPFLAKVSETLQLELTPRELKENKMVLARAIEVRAPQKYPILVSLQVRARTPEKTLEMANAISQMVIEDHQRRFSEKIKEYYRYEKELESQIHKIDSKIDELEQTLKRERLNPQGNSIAVILLQAQLEQKESQLVGFMRELRDVRTNNHSSVMSENTKVVDPPILPKEHLNPRIKLNTVIASVIGFTASLMLAFFLETIQRVAKRKGNA